jgi:hypothetical protein
MSLNIYVIDELLCMFCDGKHHDDAKYWAHSRSSFY